VVDFVSSIAGRVRSELGLAPGTPITGLATPPSLAAASQPGTSQGGNVNVGNVQGIPSDKISDQVHLTLNALNPAVASGFGILGDTIVDALDPNRPGKKSLAQRFKEFFQSLPSLLLAGLAGINVNPAAGG